MSASSTGPAAAPPPAAPAAAAAGRVVLGEDGPSTKWRLGAWACGGNPKAGEAPKGGEGGNPKAGRSSYRRKCHARIGGRASMRPSVGKGPTKSAAAAEAAAVRGPVVAR
eukprot:scaffold22499_cov60-Isochrysis_galbana.AAC.2